MFYVWLVNRHLGALLKLEVNLAVDGRMAKFQIQ